METLKEKNIVEDERVFEKGFFVDIHWNNINSYYSSNAKKEFRQLYKKNKNTKRKNMNVEISDWISEKDVYFKIADNKYISYELLQNKILMYIISSLNVDKLLDVVLFYQNLNYIFMDNVYSIWSVYNSFLDKHKQNNERKKFIYKKIDKEEMTNIFKNKIIKEINELKIKLRFVIFKCFINKIVLEKARFINTWEKFFLIVNINNTYLDFLKNINQTINYEILKDKIVSKI